MSYAYEGLATVTVIALYKGQTPNELTTLELAVVMCDAGPSRARIDYSRYLQGPKDANALRVVLPDGRLLHGPIIDGRNEPLGGWLVFDVKERELGLEQPANRHGWKWV